jgi:predicted transcriptional regulator
MYQTNLSTRMLKEYLSFLQSSGLLEIHHSKTKYAATQKGLRFVEKWKELAELISL